MIKPLVIAVELASSVGCVFANQFMSVDSAAVDLPNLTSVRGEFKALLSADTIRYRAYADDDVNLDISSMPVSMDFFNEFDQSLRYDFLQRSFSEGVITVGDFSANLSSLNGVYASTCELDDNVQIQNISGPFACVREILTNEVSAPRFFIYSISMEVAEHA